MIYSRKSVTPHYYRGACAVVLVYDVTNPSSLMALDHWMQELEYHGLTNKVSYVLFSMLKNQEGMLSFFYLYIKLLKYIISKIFSLDIKLTLFFIRYHVFWWETSVIKGMSRLKQRMHSGGRMTGECLCLRLVLRLEFI